VLLHNASTRLDEAQQLSREHADPSRVDDALDAFAQEAIDGSDLLVDDYDATGDRSSITDVRTFAASSMERLNVLQSEVPPQSLDSLLQAAQALDQVQETSVTTCPSCLGPDIGSVPSVLAQAAQATVDSWQVAAPRPHHGGRPSGGSPLPHLPEHLPGQLPPASVTDPGTASDPAQPSQSAPQDTQQPTAGDVQHTVRHLTQGLSHPQQNDLGSTVTDTANNLLDAVGQLGNQVAGVVDDTVGGIQSILPTVP
jgi:hypothetical protein